MLFIQLVNRPLTIIILSDYHCTQLLDLDFL